MWEEDPTEITQKIIVVISETCKEYLLTVIVTEETENLIFEIEVETVE